MLWGQPIPHPQPIQQGVQNGVRIYLPLKPSLTTPSQHPPKQRGGLKAELCPRLALPTA